MSGRIATTIVGNMFPPMAALVTAPILARALGVDGRGTVAAAMGPLLLIVTISTLGIPEAITYTCAKNATTTWRSVVRGIGIVALAGAMATVVIYVASSWLSGNIASTRHLILIALIATVPTLAISVIRGASAGLQDWKAIAVERGIVSLSRVVAVSGLAVAGALTPLTATLMLAVTPLFGVIAYGGVMRRARASRERSTREEPSTQLLGYGARVWFGSLAGILLMRLDQTLLNPLSGAYQLGLYAVAVAVSELPLIVNSAVRDVVFAGESAKSSDERLTAAARISAAACLAVALAIGALVPLGLPLVFGHEFSAAVGATLILLLAVSVGPAGSVAGAGLSGRGRPGLRSSSLVVAATINLVLIVILSPSLGAVGAALATLAGNLLSSHLNIFFVTRVTQISYREFLGLRRSDLVLVSNASKQIATSSASGFKAWKQRGIVRRLLGR